ncbi:uncharacterized protein AAG666_003148, partial [Megaptera novaeangliae]
CDPRGGRGGSDSCSGAGAISSRGTCARPGCSWRRWDHERRGSGVWSIRRPRPPKECSLAKRRALAVYFAKLCALGAAGGGTEPARAAARRNPDSDGGGSYCGAFACCNLCSNTCPVAEILARTIYGKQKRAEMGMARLLTEGVYTAAFPLRELGYLFDHLGTVFFSIFLSFWAMAFLEHWEHKSTTLAHHWDCSDFQEEELTPSLALQAQNSASRHSQRP